MGIAFSFLKIESSNFDTSYLGIRQKKGKKITVKFGCLEAFWPFFLEEVSFKMIHYGLHAPPVALHTFWIESWLKSFSQAFFRFPIKVARFGEGTGLAAAFKDVRIKNVKWKSLQMSNENA